MSTDAIEPDDGTFPDFPRDSDGAAIWSDTEATDGQQVDGVTPMPRGIRYVLRNGVRVRLDVTPRDSAGQPIDPPVIAPEA